MVEYSFRIGRSARRSARKEVIKITEKGLNAQQIAEVKREAAKWLEAYEKRRP